MARRTSSRCLALICFTLVAPVALRTATSLFTQLPATSAARISAVSRQAAGKVNLVAAEVGPRPASVPKPVIECDEACIAAINSCLDEGCSVEAMMKLDAQLAGDEQLISKTLKELEKKEDKSMEEQGTIAWLSNFLGRTGTLRAQIKAMSTVKDSDFIEQLIKAAGVAFGGGRQGDYPKVGVSPYTN